MQNRRTQNCRMQSRRAEPPYIELRAEPPHLLEALLEALPEALPEALYRAPKLY